MVLSLVQARQLDSEHVTYRDEFSIPTFGSLGINSEKFSSSTPVIYFCGNSLGLMPLKTRQAITEELDVWSQRGVEGHFSHKKTPWMDIDLPLLPLMAPVVGAHHNEVAVMGSLTANLNALLVHFYRPKGTRTKILFEKQAFPSDYYAFLNLVKLAGYDESHLIQLEVKKGRTYLETQDILDAVDKHADELALICLPGIQYYTGQLFDIKAITAHAKKYPEIVVGWDLAHAVGNVVLQLHHWNVDFAVWCSYKYLNAGPGGIAGIYVHEKYTKDNSTHTFQPRLAGWWGNNAADRFKMLESFDPINSALSYRQSNPSVIDVVSLRSSLEIIEKAGGIETLRKKSILLTSYLLETLKHSHYYIAQDDPDFSKLGYRVLTPLDPEHRGSQLSLLFQPYHEEKSKNIMEKVHNYLHQHGIICDERRPNVIRLAPTALYNTFEEVYYVGKRLKEAMDSTI